MLMDILNVILWCFAVYVCVFDWEDAKKTDGNVRDILKTIRQNRKKPL